MKKAFTILEMILVLMVVTIMILLTIPNINKKRQIINDVGCRALVEVINGQILVYELENGEVSSIDQLVDAELISPKQTVCPNGQNIVIEHGQAVAR